MVGARGVAAIRQQAIAAARELEPGLLALGEAQRMLGDVTAAKNALATIEVLLAKRIADTGEWRRAGDRSAEEHLAKTTGVSVGRAREALDTAQRLGGLGATDAAARSGTLSLEQAAAVADAATADPSAEETLLRTASRGSMQALREICAKVKAAADADPENTYRRHRAGRRLRIWADRDGTSKLFGVSTPDQMAIICAAVERRTSELFHAARRAGTPEPRGAYMIDALGQICAAWLGDTDGNEALASGTVAPPNQKRTDRARRPVFLGVVRADLAALRRGAVAGGEVCEIAGLGPVPVATAKHLLSESVLYLVLTNGSAVGTTVNLKRGPNTAQRVALLATQPNCEISGCYSPFTEIDHDDPWARRQSTELTNLRRKCTHHHDLKTQGWATVEEDDVVLMVPPDDPRHPQNANGLPKGPAP